LPYRKLQEWPLRQTRLPARARRKRFRIMPVPYARYLKLYAKGLLGKLAPPRYDGVQRGHDRKQQSIRKQLPAITKLNEGAFIQEGRRNHGGNHCSPFSQ
jgi:hypothetical protein